MLLVANAYKALEVLSYIFKIKVLNSNSLVVITRLYSYCYHVLVRKKIFIGITAVLSDKLEI